MLGDTAAKPKNSFIGIRRKRKTVVFAEPTYVDYSDFDYSTDEEDIDELFGSQGPAQHKQQQDDQGQQQDSQEDIDAQEIEETAKVEPLHTSKETSDSVNGANGHKDDEISKENVALNSQHLVKADDAGEVSPDDLADEKPDGPSRSRNGTVRNTDSFFRDSSETKKITLTPNLLRDDDSQSPPSDSANREAKQRTSLDKMEKELVSDKEKRKSRDKKPSAIRNFFSRKDKKRASEDDDESFGKRSMDIISEPRESEDKIDEPTSPDKSAGNQRKLQKPQPRIEPSIGRKGAVGQTQRSTVELSSYLNETRINDMSSVPPASMRIVDPHTQETREIPSNQQSQQQQQQQQTRDAVQDRSEPSAANAAKSALSKIVPRMNPGAATEVKPQKTIKAKTRMELEVSDESDMERENALGLQSSGPVSEDSHSEVLSSNPDPVGIVARATTSTPQQQVTQSPREHQGGGDASLQTSPSTASNPPALVADTSSAEGRSPEASPSPEPSQSKDGSTTSRSKEAQWDDDKLRAFFDDSEHIRDLLAVVYDKSDLGPVGMDHPIAGGLFREQNAKLAEITTVSTPSSTHINAQIRANYYTAIR